MLLLVFIYRWCGPCKQLAPKLDSLIEMKDGAIELAKVDIDENAELAMQYEVCILVHELEKISILEKKEKSLCYNTQLLKHQN